VWQQREASAREEAEAEASPRREAAPPPAPVELPAGGVAPRALWLEREASAREAGDAAAEASPRCDAPPPPQQRELVPSSGGETPRAVWQQREASALDEETRRRSIEQGDAAQRREAAQLPEQRELTAPERRLLRKAQQAEAERDALQLLQLARRPARALLPSSRTAHPLAHQSSCLAAR